MPDYVILENDIAQFMPAFSPAIVVVKPGNMPATGKTKVAGKNICLKGDEARLMVAGCSYMTPVYSIPGVGTLKIQSLAPNQLTVKSKSGGKNIILKGAQFIAVFEVQTPAQQPPKGPTPPIPDATPKYMGNGSFITTNLKFKAT